MSTAISMFGFICIKINSSCIVHQIVEQIFKMLFFLFVYIFRLELNEILAVIQVSVDCRALLEFDFFFRFEHEKRFECLFW